MIKQLREEWQMPQRKFAAALEIDTATYWKIEKDERKTKAEQVVVIDELLETNKNELLTFWLADQITAVVVNDKELSNNVLDIAKGKIKNKL